MVASWSHLFPAFQQRSQTALRWVSSNKIFLKKISLCFVTLAKVSPFGRNSQCTPPVSQSPRHPRRIRGGTGFSALVSTKVGSTNFSRVALRCVLLSPTVALPYKSRLGPHKALLFKDPPAKVAPIRNEKGVISQSFWYL